MADDMTNSSASDGTKNPSVTPLSTGLAPSDYVIIGGTGDLALRKIRLPFSGAILMARLPQIIASPLRRAAPYRWMNLLANSAPSARTHLPAAALTPTHGTHFCPF